MQNNEINSNVYDELPSSEPCQESIGSDEQISPSLDNLLCGITTLRDENGVVSSNAFDGMTDNEKRMLSKAGYSNDEVYPEPQKIETLDLSSVRFGWINDALIRETSGGRWRDLVNAGLPVRDGLCGVLFEAMLAVIKALPNHLFDALHRQPGVARDAAEEIVKVIQESDPEAICYRLSSSVK